MCGFNKGIGGPKRPHDAHDAGSWGSARRCTIKPKKTLNILWAIFVALDTSVSGICSV